MDKIIKVIKELIDSQTYSEAADYIRQYQSNETLLLLVDIFDDLNAQEKKYFPYDNRYELLLALATKGCDQAMIKLADIYKEGNSVCVQNPKKAFMWYEKAYNMGNKDALNPLIYCYRNGFGTQQDISKVVQLKKELKV